MSDEEDDAVQAVTRLNRLTQEGELQWNTTESEAVENTRKGRLKTAVFATNLDGKRLFLYGRRVQKKVPNDATTRAMQQSLTTGNPLPAAPGETYVDSETVLEIVDVDGNPVWKFPQTSALEDLLSTVSYHASGAGELIDKLTEEQSENS